MEGAGLGTQTIWVGGEPRENKRQGCYGLSDLLVGYHGNQAGGREMVSGDQAPQRKDEAESGRAEGQLWPQGGSEWHRSPRLECGLGSLVMS